MQIDLVLCMRFLGEFVGSAMLVCLGCLGYTNDEPLLKSLHLGLVVMVVVHCFGFVSGAHANPCISLACCLMGYISAHITCVYVVAQFLGALFGYYLLTVVLPETTVNSQPGLCMTVPSNTVSSEQAFAIEFLLTAILILGWCALWDVRNSRYLDSISLRVGFLVTACCLAGGHLTGASMNPARTLAPAIFHNDYETIGVYFASQLLAAVTIPYVWWFLFIPRCSFSFNTMENENVSENVS